MIGGVEGLCSHITGPPVLIVTRDELRFIALKFSRRLCDHIQRCTRRRPVALRPTLSSGLPLSGLLYCEEADQQISGQGKAYHCSK